MNKHKVTHHQVLTFPAVTHPLPGSSRVSMHLTASVRQALVQAAEAYADAHNLSLVTTRDERPRFYADGQQLTVRLLDSESKKKLIENKSVQRLNKAVL